MEITVAHDFYMQPSSSFCMKKTDYQKLIVSKICHQHILLLFKKQKHKCANILQMTHQVNLKAHGDKNTMA